MKDLTSGLIIVAITGLLVGMTFILVFWNKKQRETALRNLASINGWTVEIVNERNASGYRLRKGEWMIESLNQTSNNSSDNSSSTTVTSLTRWVSDAARMPEGIVLIGPQQPDINFGGLGEMVKQVALRVMIGSEFDNAVGIERVELGSLELMARYMVWTNREEIAKKLVDQPVENALRAWPLKLPPVVKFSPSGLEIKYQGPRLYKEQDITALAKLGNTLLDSAYQVVKGI
ncbi:MAG: hypothetical protein C0410_14615 [Anaerolinea sp.]|nr:hypothetical protein [Anaerolinea sp.]